MAAAGDLSRPHSAQSERLWTVVEETSDLVSTATTEGRIIYLNRAGREFFGLSPESDLPDLEVTACHPEHAARVVREVAIPSAIRNGIWRGDTELLRRDGRCVPASQVIIAHRGADGGVEYLSTILRDISELKEKEQALRLSEERFRAAIKGSSIIVSATDAERRYIWLYNPHPRFDESEWLGKRDEELAPYEHVKELIRIKETVLRSGEPRRASIPVQIGDELRRYDVQVEPLLDDREEVIGLTVAAMDITEHARTEAALRRSEAELNDLTRDLERRVERHIRQVERQADQLRALAAEVTEAEQRERRRLSRLLHDHLQQILVAARIKTEILASDPGDGDSGRGAAAIKDLLVQAIETSRNLSLELSPPVLLEASLGEALQWLANRMEERHHLAVRFDGDLDVEPESDTLKGMLFEAARELLLNVVKHAGVLECSLRLELDADDRIRLEVADEGGGFDPDALGSGSEVEAFGLFHIQHRLEAAAGHCRIDSAPGHGTRITLSVDRQALWDAESGEPR